MRFAAAFLTGALLVAMALGLEYLLIAAVAR